MAGYVEFSKSVNAAEAEASGKFPATEAGRVLGISGKFIIEAVSWASHGEWHHTSKYYNAVPYFDTEEIQRWIDGDPDLIEAHGNFQEVFENWKTAQKLAKVKPVSVFENVTVNWLEWGGTRSHPRAFERKELGATVFDAGGKFVTVKLQDGTSFKKGKDTRGFEAHDSTGKRIFL